MSKFLVGLGCFIVGASVSGMFFSEYTEIKIKHNLTQNMSKLACNTSYSDVSQANACLSTITMENIIAVERGRYIEILQALQQCGY
mgnify:FL=1